MKIGQAERITGCEIRGGALDAGPNLGPWSMISYTAFEKTDTGERPYACVTARGSPASVLKKLVEEVYRTRCMEARRLAGYRCQRCHALKPLQAHHREFRSHGRRDTPENIEILCEDCHRNIHCPKPIPKPKIRAKMRG